MNWQVARSSYFSFFTFDPCRFYSHVILECSWTLLGLLTQINGFRSPVPSLIYRPSSSFHEWSWHLLPWNMSNGKRALTLTLLVASFANKKLCKNQKNDWNLTHGYWSISTQRELSNEYQHDRVTETLANGYLSESTQRGLSNEYQHRRVKMVFKNLCIIVLWTRSSLSIGRVDICSWQH